MAEHDKRPASGNDAVVLATRWLRLQVDLSACRAETAGRDPFVAGYLWGFCGGVLAEVETGAPGLFPFFSMVARRLFGDRDGPHLLARIHRVFQDPDFEAGEVAGLVDARRSMQTARPTVGLIAHLRNEATPRGGASRPGDPDAA